MNNYYPNTKKVFEYIKKLSDKDIIFSNRIEDDLKMENVYVRKALSTLYKDGHIFRAELGRYLKWDPNKPSIINDIDMLRDVLEKYLDIKISAALTPIEHLNRSGFTNQITGYKRYLYSIDKVGIPDSKVNKIIRDISNLRELFISLNKPSTIALVVSDYFNNTNEIANISELIYENFSGLISISDNIENDKNAYKLDKLLYKKVSMVRFEEIISDKKYKDKFVIFPY